MKNTIFVLSLLLLMTCKKSDDDAINNCNFLQNIGVNRTISLNLPQYSQLQFSTESVYIANEGNAGIYVVNIGGNFRAFDAADPNRTISSCSFLVKDGTNVSNTCEDQNTYNLLTGLSVDEQLPCALHEYRVTANGNELTISN
ncbi:hypothetical protein [Psychroserpens sp. S379A]|uniref:hypothetical protein n=1 Tax=Psychroserpens sp. S379A TaxID=3415137 RepID=UPI003C7AD316